MHIDALGVKANRSMAGCVGVWNIKLFESLYIYFKSVFEKDKMTCHLMAYFVYLDNGSCFNGFCFELLCVTTVPTLQVIINSSHEATNQPVQAGMVVNKDGSSFNCSLFVTATLIACCFI